MLDTLRASTNVGVDYVVERAHRQTDDYEPNPGTDPEGWARYGTHYKNFRFDRANFDIDAYDQIWLFGILLETDPSGLGDAELVILARWMNKGGGILAMGDHEDLGAALCRRIPRVRAMRYWKSSETPPIRGVSRHDTLRSGHDELYTFDDESDDVPQPLQLRRYECGEVTGVHPILAGPRQPLDVFPDHPHEGEVVPDDKIVLDGTFVLDATTVDEFPEASNGGPRPETIAWGQVLGNRGDNDRNKGPVNAKTFAVLGAYDGHKVGVGRVVVDSTWHHWFDVNLVGRPVKDLNTPPFDETNPKTKGFLATESGRAIYARLQACYRNVGLWLCPVPVQERLIANELWAALHRQPLIESLRASDDLDEIGRISRAALLTRTDHLSLRLRLLASSSTALTTAQTSPEFAETLECFCLGAIFRNMLELHEHGSADRALRGGGTIDDARLLDCVREGLATGQLASVEHMRERFEGLRQAIDGLSKALAPANG